MAISDAKRKADAKWAKKAYEQIKIQSRREKRLNDLIKYASHKRNMSSAAYIVMAVEHMLEMDNVDITCLTEVSPDQQPNEIDSTETDED